uniref:Uncharacterized protein n=1 Tax=Hyaloperonospora arabidopsidis (strain Emoy2) TaxID=559515 RepID=M4BR23_HYAAE
MAMHKRRQLDRSVQKKRTVSSHKIRRCYKLYSTTSLWTLLEVPHTIVAYNRTLTALPPVMCPRLRSNLR